MHRSRYRLPPIGAALCAALVACGGGGPGGAQAPSPSAPPPAPSSPAPGTATGRAPGEQDVVFVQRMVLHHRGAVDLADTAVARASSAQVRELAASISAARAPQVEEMTSWLDARGEPVPAGSSMGGEDPADPADPAAAGTSNLEEVQELEGATGAGFDRAFLRLVVAHHEAGVAAAAAERTGGTDPWAVELASRIEREESAEAQRARDLLGTLGG
ncbi:DUF305 domain-containing protein [Kineococcus sp. SYSU DK005]|uniref:DUF305 domain-containing protein n=1 Tax=Kineococcus sp. SYSU DK005 TaxID=3383126 RepID=UPI003D7D3856